MSQRTVLVMAGGTGGHIFPALAVASQLKKAKWRVVWLGAEGAMETQIVPKQDKDILLVTLNVKGVRGKGLAKWLTLPWIQGRALYKAIRVMQQYRPDVVIGFGGFTSFAGGIAAKLLGRPLVVHEQNAVAGLTNRLLAKFATRVLFAFPSAFSAKEGLVGNPVREDLLDLPAPIVRFQQRTGPIKLVIVGGSLGASVLNNVVPKALAQIKESRRPEVLHQAGSKHIDMLKANYQEVGVKAQCVSFIDDMASVLANADLVVCRAGALTIAELTAVGVASILVPFKAAVDDHQTHNAHYLTESGAGILIPQDELTPERLAACLQELTRSRLLKMAQKAQKLALKEATKEVVSEIKRLAEIR